MEGVDESHTSHQRDQVSMVTQSFTSLLSIPRFRSQKGGGKKKKRERETKFLKAYRMQFPSSNSRKQNFVVLVSKSYRIVLTIVRLDEEEY